MPGGWRGWTGGLRQNEGAAARSADPIIQNYMHERSRLLGQRRRLAATYGADSLAVSQVDRQIQLVDEAMSLRRRQLVEEETARQQVSQMKQEATPMAQNTISQPATEPAR